MIPQLLLITGTLYISALVGLVAGLCRCYVEVVKDNNFEMIRNLYNALKNNNS